MELPIVLKFSLFNFWQIFREKRAVRVAIIAATGPGTLKVGPIVNYWFGPIGPVNYWFVNYWLLTDCWSDNY